MSDEELKRLEELCAKASPGPWESGDFDVVGGQGGSEETVANIYTPAGKVYLQATRPSGQGVFADAEFIAAAREAVPKLVALVREADAEIRRLRGLIKAVESASGYQSFHGVTCPWCDSELRDEKHSAHCPAFTPSGEVK